jgi:hypothetical protein
MNFLRLKLIFFISLTLIIGACTKVQEVENNSLKPIVLNNLADSRDKVLKSLKYKEYDYKNECEIRTEEKTRYCVNIDNVTVSLENGLNYIYAVETGSELNESNEKMTSHVNLGSLKFFKFEVLSEDELKLVSESDLLSCGPFGSTCSAVTYKYGNGPELGWLVTTGDMHQGNAGSFLMAFTAFDKKISQYLNIQTSFSNEGAAGDDESEVTIKDISTKITTVPSTSAKYFDLKINISGKEIKKKKSTPVEFSTVIKFDSKTNSYPTDAVDKFY